MRSFRCWLRNQRKEKRKIKIPTIKEVVDIIDRVLVPQMEMHIKNAKDENNEMMKHPFDRLDYMYNRGQISLFADFEELEKNDGQHR